MKRLHDQRGSALVEFALVFPILLIVVLASLSFLWMLTARSALTGAARDGARFASIRKDPHCAVPTDTWGRSCSADWPTQLEVEDYVQSRAGRFAPRDGDVTVSRPDGIGAYPNAPVTVTVKGDLPVLIQPVAALLVFDTVKFTTSGKARDE